MADEIYVVPQDYLVAGGPTQAHVIASRKISQQTLPLESVHGILDMVNGLKGLAIPFGCGIFFLPAPTKYTNSKSCPKMSCGVFLGYRLQPGGTWSGEYIVADLYDFVGCNLHVDTRYLEFKHLRPHITDSVSFLGKGKSASRSNSVMTLRV